MMNRGAQKVFSVLLALCLTLGLCTVAVAQSATADFEAMLPLMDLVCAASQYSPNAPESVPGADGQLSVSFTDAFFKLGAVYGAELGISDATLGDVNAQAALLGQFFAAQLPTLEPVAADVGIDGYYSFQPVTYNNGTDGTSIQIIGDMYLADKPIRAMNETELASAQWMDCAVFTFQSDASAWNGFRLTGYSVGTDLTVESVIQSYFEAVAVEYESKLGFTVMYPSVFDDERLVEDDNGVSATLADGSASFFAKRVDNENGASLADYVGIIANGITGSISNVNEEMQYGTVAYTTEDGFAVFDVFIVTDKHIYQAELSYLTSLMTEYRMYNAYLENSFVVNELSQG